MVLWGPWVWFVMTEELSVRVRKVTLRIGVSWIHSQPVFLDLFLTHKMSILWKGSKPDNFELHNSLKLSFAYISGLCSNFVECGSFLKSNSPDVFALCETNLNNSIDSGNFKMRQTWMTHLILAILRRGIIFL